MRRRKVLCFLTVAPCLPLLVTSLYWLLTVRAKNTVSYTFFSEDIQRRRENETLTVMHKFNTVGKSLSDWYCQEVLFRVYKFVLIKQS